MKTLKALAIATALIGTYVVAANAHPVRDPNAYCYYAGRAYGYGTIFHGKQCLPMGDHRHMAWFPVRHWH